MEIVSIRRAKSTAALYDECKDVDLVLMPDAALADALNRHLDRPHFGPFAVTPRRLAAERREQAEDRLAFLDVIERTDLDWKKAAYVVGNVLQCRSTGALSTLSSSTRASRPSRRGPPSRSSIPRPTAADTPKPSTANSSACTTRPERVVPRSRGECRDLLYSYGNPGRNRSALASGVSCAGGGRVAIVDR